MLGLAVGQEIRMPRKRHTPEQIIGKLREVGPGSFADVEGGLP